MNLLENKPLFTEVYNPASSFQLAATEIVVRGQKKEERHSWADDLPRDQVIEVVVINEARFSVILPEGAEEFSFRSNNDINRLLDLIALDFTCIIIDLTSLAHAVWALLLRGGLKKGIILKACYAEPIDYQQHVTPPMEGEIFDLSERIEGVRPLPGFASFQDDIEDDFILVPLLGFEGTRFAHIIETTQPKGGHVIPVFGFPGFQPEFIFHTYLGNKLPLLRTSSQLQARFVPANCPFSLAYLLEQIADEYKLALLKIALIGTKPHALGAFLFERRNKRQVEFIYDHPVRKENRTFGISKLLLYNVSAFLDSGRVNIV
jgi:hypothetical protein